jgi:hypothetical protein
MVSSDVADAVATAVKAALPVEELLLSSRKYGLDLAGRVEL